MCGIAGFNGRGSEDDLSHMIRQLKHRGPDHQEHYFNENFNLGFAHARLSIIDLSNGANQPFFTADKSAVIVFNGEIYNFHELKEELLKKKKYEFITTSDTEVLLYLYKEYGKDLLDKINGMFAFAIYDFEKKELFIARDRMGKKPLYYAVKNNTLIFASELKALLKHPFIDAQPDANAINSYFTFDYVPTPASPIKDVKQLEPAHYIIFKNGAIAEYNAYWKINFEKRNIAFNDAKEEFDILLNDAVSCRMISDVPLGVFLSGGLDSSTVAYYAQKNSAQKIKTFSIGFEDSSYDESNYAALVAKQLGTQHSVEFLSPKRALELIPTVMQLMDTPFADASLIPTYMLSEFTRKHVTVALGGDGSDELLAGYPTFLSEYVRPYVGVLPHAFIRLMDKMTDFLPVSDKNISLDFQIKQFLKGFELDKKSTHTLWLGSFSPSQKNLLLSDDFRSTISNGNGMEAVYNSYESVKNEKYTDQLLNSYYKTYLLDDILVKVDRASMFNSLEVRAPFLDRKVVEFLNSIPYSLKRRFKKEKFLLKELMRNRLPDVIIDRPKKGFGIPLSSWLRKDLKPLRNSLLDEKLIREQGIFNPAYVNNILKEHDNLKHNHRKLLWNLMAFQLWYNNYIKKAD